MDKIEVLVVDDSALMRKMISDILSSHPMIEAKDTAINGKVALNKLKKNTYDVILLDIEMPEMDGLQFLDEYIKLGINTPVIILSSFAKRGAEVTIKALSLGAKDFITKPSGPISIDIEKVKNQILEKVLVWGLKSPRNTKTEDVEITPNLSIVETKHVEFRNPSIREVVAKKNILPKVLGIGISTGGPPTIRKFLSSLGNNFPLGIVIAQHMPEFFTSEFAKSLELSFPHFTIVESKEYDIVVPGKIIIAKGGKHIIIDSKDNRVFTRTVDDDRFIFRPSVDMLFESMANSLGRNAIGIIMTGMGSDGAKGLKKLHDAGAITIAQGEKSSVIFGMPKSAIKMSAVDFVWELDEMGQNLNQLLSLLL
ncbi:MAG: chemotaxis-specific protein-glutamate methyltransferase CheB [Brevinematales bacterium]|nr:chemotaxis-specific protein-glutamate methyltransferase CheB [Brevinematales bacterium]